MNYAWDLGHKGKRMRYIGLVILVLAVIAIGPGCSGSDSDGGSTATTGSGTTTEGTTGTTTGEEACPEGYKDKPCCMNDQVTSCCCIQEGCEEVADFEVCGDGSCAIAQDPEMGATCP